LRENNFWQFSFFFLERKKKNRKIWKKQEAQISSWCSYSCV